MEPSLVIVLCSCALGAYHLWRGAEACGQAAAAGPACRGCGQEIHPDDRFCERCGRARG